VARETEKKQDSERLTPKQERALASLIACPTIRAAAEDAGVNEGTLYGWLKDPRFKNRYDDLRRQAVDSALTALQHACSAAVQALRDNLHCDTPAVRNRAAEIILSHTIKARELEELEQRIAALEAALKSPKG
jgi:hypothetical protein